MKNKKKIIVIIAFIIETIILGISLLYSSAIYFIKDNQVEWFDEVSPDGKYHVKCYKVGTPLFFSSQDLLIYFGKKGMSFEQGINSVSFKTELANDGANLYDDNYSIEWLSDSVKIIFRGEETGGDNVYIIPYYNINTANTDNSDKVEVSSVRYNYNYGEIFEISNNTMYYGKVKEEKEKYFTQELSENFKVINFENEETININNIEVGDYVSIYAPTEEYQNAEGTIIVAKNDYILEQVKEKLLNKREFSAAIAYYNAEENYIIAEIALPDKKIISKRMETLNAQPCYYIKLNVGKNTETYLGNKENNLNANYGYQVNELCWIELMSNISYLPNTYIVKSIEFIAD